MKSLAIKIGVLIIAFAIYRPIARWWVTPPETRAVWVEPLATWGHIAETSPLDPIRQEKVYLAVSKSNEQKHRLWEVFTSGKGHYGLATRYSTVEGAWIYTWLLAEDGKLRYVHDHTRDGGGMGTTYLAPGTGVDIYAVRNARLGFLREGNFIEGQPGHDNSPILVLEIDIGRSAPERFY